MKAPQLMSSIAISTFICVILAVWQCNGGVNQRFELYQGEQWSFMTTFGDALGQYELVSTNSAWGSPAEIGSVTAASAGPTGASDVWNYIN